MTLNYVLFFLVPKKKKASIPDELIDFTELESRAEVLLRMERFKAPLSNCSWYCDVTNTKQAPAYTIVLAVLLYDCV